MIENNIVFRYGNHGIGICSKGRNHIINNIIACPPGKVVNGMIAPEPQNNKSIAGSRILHNILFATQADQPFILLDGIKDVIGSIEIDCNIYYNPSNKNAADDYLDWARKNNNEAKSVQSDPGFVDVEKGDFRLKPNSTAIKAGFRPFMLDAGCTLINK